MTDLGGIFENNENNRVVAFIHSYQADGGFDPYMSLLIRTMEKEGVELFIIKTNDLVSRLADNKFRISISETRLVQYINKIDPLFILSINRGGISKAIMKGTSCPIITRMVDLVPFMHQGGVNEDLFCERDIVYVPTRESIEPFERQYPVLRGRVHYLPFATDPSEFSGSKDIVKDIPISFVGTYFYCQQLTQILYRLQGCERQKRDSFLQFMRVMQEGFFEGKSFSEDKILQDIGREFALSCDDIRMIVSNAYALNKRIHYLDSVADLGLKLFGTSNWIEVNQFSLPVLFSFQFDEEIYDRKKLINVYQRSKIALNIPHHQAGAGLPYRVFDIMASSALLITEYHSESELFDLFGEDMPVPMYRDAVELRELVVYYLEHEEERKKLVGKCNALIRKKKLTFENKVHTYLSEVGIAERTGHIGCVHYVKSTEFRSPFFWGWGVTEGISVCSILGRLKAMARWIVPYNIWLSLSQRKRG